MHDATVMLTYTKPNDYVITIAIAQLALSTAALSYLSAGLSAALAICLQLRVQHLAVLSAVLS